MQAPRYLLPALAFAAAAIQSAGEQASPPYPPVVLANTQLRTLPRSANGRDYMLYVGLPDSYDKEPRRRYPVLYICDGQYDFGLIKGFYGNLRYDKVVPEFIIVGFSYPGHFDDYNPMRFYDYLAVPEPAINPDTTRTGHAAEFLSVVEKEFIPLVERDYRVDPSYRVLGGSSAGGHFALYALFTKPELFQAYIAISPATNVGHDWLFDYEDRFFRSGRAFNARLFMTGAGAESPPYLEAIERFDQRLQSRHYPGLVYQWRLLDGERHAGSKPEGYNRGIRFAFAPLAPLNNP